MTASVSMLMLGVVVIAMLGSVFGYLLEPGRFQRRGQTNITGYELGPDEHDDLQDNDTSRRAA